MSVGDPYPQLGHIPQTYGWICPLCGVVNSPCSQRCINACQKEILAGPQQVPPTLPAKSGAVTSGGYLTPAEMELIKQAQEMRVTHETHQNP